MPISPLPYHKYKNACDNKAYANIKIIEYTLIINTYRIFVYDQVGGLCILDYVLTVVMIPIYALNLME